jgi:hypothetical protein
MRDNWLNGVAWELTGQYAFLCKVSGGLKCWMESILDVMWLVRGLHTSNDNGRLLGVDRQSKTLVDNLYNSMTKLYRQVTHNTFRRNIIREIFARSEK